MNRRATHSAKLLGATTLLLAGLCALPASSQAYDLKSAGGKVGYANPENLDGTMMVGGQLEFENHTRVHLLPGLAYWKTNRVSNVSPNVDLMYHFDRQTQTTPYVGGGLGLDVRNSDITDRTRTSLNASMIGGLRIPGGSNHYFVEGRYTAGELQQVALVGGIMFHTHGR